MISKQSGRLILLFPERAAAGRGLAQDFTRSAGFSAPDWRLLLRLGGEIALKEWKPEASFAQMLLNPDLEENFSTLAAALPDWSAADSQGIGSGAGQGAPRGKIAGRGLPADLYVSPECSSTFDLAWRLAELNQLGEWAAVLALRQSSGRGQLRRTWHSPAGNLYLSFRLPDSFRKREAASILTALLLIQAFDRLGLKLNLKWPNDLVLRQDGRPAKLGGILLEERGEILLAGSGINCLSAPPPDMLRADAAMPAGVLPGHFKPLTPISLGLELVQKMILMYEKTFQTTSTLQLLHQSEKYLLWKGSEVQVRDFGEDGSVVTGVLRGLTELGGLRLLVSGKNVSPGSSFGPLRTSGPEELALYSGSLKGTD